MKKYLLTALLGVFAFIGFTNAENISIVSDSSDIYSPSTILLTNDYTFSVSDIISYNIGNEFGSCDLNLNSSNSYDNFCDFYITSDGVSIDDEYLENCSFSNGDTIYINRTDGNACASIVLKNPNFSSSSEGDSESGTLLPTGTGALSGIIENLGTTISEFIPYLVFIGLGLLGAIIGFVAIKWLMNRVRAKVYGTFSGGRRR